MMYDGNENRFTDELQHLGVKLVRHRVSFFDALSSISGDSLDHLAIISGAFLRVELPLVEVDDDLILYTDCDVVFQRGFQIPTVQPVLFACATEFSQTDYDNDMNSGSMVMNLPALRADLPQFTKFIRDNLSQGWPGADQAHYRRFYQGRWDRLAIEYNWKPYWGVNADASIVHWHGPKPLLVRKFIHQPDLGTSKELRRIFDLNQDAYLTFLQQWDEIAVTVPQTIRGNVDLIDDRSIVGWALYEDWDKAARLTVEIDGEIAGEVICNLERADLQPIFGTSAGGFRFDIPERFGSEGQHAARLLDESGCPVELGWDSQHATTFFYVGARSAELPLPVGTSLAQLSPRISCYLDEITPTRMSGWAVNVADPEEPVELAIWLDGNEVTKLKCDIRRVDLQCIGITASAGFSFSLPRKYFDNQEHSLQIRVANNPISFHWRGSLIETHMFCERWHPKIINNIDGVREGVIKGWVLVEDPTSAKRVGGAHLLVTCDGVHVGKLKADRHRADVGKHYAAEANCGFEFFPPPAYRRGRTHAFHFYLLPYEVEMAGSPVVTSIVTDQQQADLLALSDSLDSVHREVTRLRRQMRMLVPQPVFNIRDYDAWASDYFGNLRKRTLAARHAAARNRANQNLPLVSIICPTFQPRLDYFIQAVELVVNQTYSNWELIIVDDGSFVPELTDQIDNFARRDPRIKAIKRVKNGGISSATNAGIKAAKGDWIAFFDHDDLLVETALEIMITAGQQHDVKVVYSDEDKVDDAGTLSEPAFKPDWNYRMLLAANYVSHFLMAKTSVVRLAGSLNPRYDGAQDHAFILRLSEILLPSEICHVPEVLYHWRKSASSTASSIGAKHYAIEAGVAAVTDHLSRLGKIATVSSINENTWYSVNWGFTDTPSVSIVIPFTDQIAMTRDCINRALSSTDYGNFNLILLDNWSISEDAAKFSAEMARLDNVKILRFEEPFNYSRLNNAAAAISNAELFVLMNNDLLITHRSWLRVMVNEVLADEKVAVVGGKFLYPNGTVQHAGVVLGIGGVAAHVHTGLAADDPGYAARALFAQEMSCVTAACLLIRSSVYRQVGGLDENHLKVAFNDVDLCLKVRAAGWKIIWTPDFIAEHHESLSRGDDEMHAHKEARFFDEMQVMQSRWGDALRTDPYYSKHFLLEGRPYYDLASEPPKKSSFPIIDSANTDVPTGTNARSGT